MKISIIIPCFNAIDKIGRCLASLNKINWPKSEFEVRFVDDCSDDGTFEYLRKICKATTNWYTEKLTINSGSPSRPRNFGVEKALGDYIFFLDVYLDQNLHYR